MFFAKNYRCKTVEPCKAKFAVGNMFEIGGEVAKLVPLDMRWDKAELTRNFKTRLVLDKVEPRWEKAKCCFSDLNLFVFYVLNAAIEVSLPEGVRKDKSWQRLDVYTVVYPHQVQLQIYSEDDVAFFHFLLMERGYILLALLGNPLEPICY